MKVNSIEEYLGTLQGSMVESWKSHLKTDKYSDHIALNEFYDEIVELVDALIEEYQGIYGKVKDLKNVMTTDKQSALDYLESLREMTREGKSLFKEDELKSDIDAILSLLDSTIYKLKELKENDQHKSMRSLSSYLTERLNESHPEAINEANNWKVDGPSKQKVDNVVDLIYNGDKHAHMYIAYDDSIEVYSLIAASSVSDIEQWISTLAASIDEEDDIAEKIFNMKFDRIDMNYLRKLNLTSIYRIK